MLPFTNAAGYPNIFLRTTAGARGTECSNALTVSAGVLGQLFMSSLWRASCNPPSHAGFASESASRAARHLVAELARQPRADCRELAHVDAGDDAEAVEEPHEVLGREVAGGLPRERRAADAAGARVRSEERRVGKEG